MIQTQLQASDSSKPLITLSDSSQPVQAGDIIEQTRGLEFRTDDWDYEHLESLTHTVAGSVQVLCLWNVSLLEGASDEHTANARVEIKETDDSFVFDVVLKATRSILPGDGLYVEGQWVSDEVKRLIRESWSIASQSHSSQKTYVAPGAHGLWVFLKAGESLKKWEKIEKAVALPAPGNYPMEDYFFEENYIWLGQPWHYNCVRWPSWEASEEPSIEIAGLPEDAYGDEPFRLLIVQAAQDVPAMDEDREIFIDYGKAYWWADDIDDE